MISENIDYSSFFNHNVFLFKLLGFWKPDRKMRYRRLYNVYTGFCITIWLLFLGSQCMLIYQNIDDVVELTGLMYITGTFSMVLIRMITVYLNMELIKELMPKLKQPLFQVKSKHHLKLAKSMEQSNKFLFRICLYFGLQTYIFFSAIPFISNEKITLTKGWFPFNWSVSPYYEMVYIFQNSVALWNVLICLNMDTFTSGLLMFVGLQCDFLCLILNDMGRFKFHNGDFEKVVFGRGWYVIDVKDRKDFSRKMRAELIICIEHYKEIKRLTRDVEDIYRASALIMFIGGGIILCSGLFQLSLVEIGSLESLMLLSYLSCMLIEQFLYCWFGSEVMYKSHNIFVSIYNTPWFECDPKYRKILLQFMVEAQTPLTLKAGGLFTMSIRVFVSILRTSYSYLTLLQRFQE